MGKYRILDNNLWGLKGTKGIIYSLGFNVFHKHLIWLTIFNDMLTISTNLVFTSLWTV